MAYNMIAAIGAVAFVFGLFIFTSMRQNRLARGNSFDSYTPVELIGSIGCLIGLIVCAALAIMSIVF